MTALYTVPCLNMYSIINIFLSYFVNLTFSLKAIVERLSYKVDPLRLPWRLLSVRSESADVSH